MNDIEHVAAAHNEAGESPHWDSATQTLTWADIVDPHLCRFHPASGRLETWKIDVPVTGLGLRQSGGLVMASKTGLYLWDAAFTQSTFLSDPEASRPNVRFNDGLVDPQGRYWAGTLNEVDTKAADGSLYRLDPDSSLHTMDVDLGGPNGIGWSPDHRTMYLADSWRQLIYAYDFDEAGGSVSNRRVFAEVPPEDGMPDGLAVDADGFVWNARWNGWRVTRYDPDGRIEREVRLPVANVTSCAFGGEGRDELYITTAWFLLDEAGRRQQPFAGDLFRLCAGIRGMADPKFLG